MTLRKIMPQLLQQKYFYTRYKKVAALCNAVQVSDTTKVEKRYHCPLQNM
jgi:hypothetical protein